MTHLNSAKPHTPAKIIIGWLLVSLGLAAGLLLPPAARADGPVPLPGTPGWLSDLPDESRHEHAWGDLDGDGDLDAAVIQDTKILVFLNSGYDDTGNLSIASGGRVVPQGDEESNVSGGNDIALGDIDSDGDLDMVIGKTWPGPTPPKVYLNQGFNAAGNLVVSTVELPYPDFAEDVALGDMNGDGKLDVAVVNGQHAARTGRPDYIHQNTTSPGGPVQFTTVWANSGVYSQTSNMAAWGDPDQDGDLDLAIAGDYTFHFFENIDGMISSAPALTLTQPTLGAGFLAMDWGDVDVDGFPELAVTTEFAWLNNRLFKIEKQGQSWQLTTVWTSREYRGESAKFGDVDNDGDLDLVTDRADGPLLVFQNRAGVLDTNPTWVSDSSFDTRFAHWVDIDNDGDLDVSSSGTQSPLVLFLNQGYLLDDASILESAPRTETTFGLAWGDVDGDGTLELAAGRARNKAAYNGLILPWQPPWSSADNLIYRVTDSGLVADAALWKPANSRTTLGLAWGDVDGDGDLDLAVANRPGFDRDVINDGQNELYLNNGDGLAAIPAATFGAGDEYTIAVAWGDINGDGRLDLVTGDYGGLVRLYLNDNGTLPAVAGWSSADSAPITDLVLGDVDTDGDLDLVVSEFNAANRIKVYLNQGGQFPAKATQEFAVSQPFSIDLGDFDADGDPDLAVGVYGGANLVFANEAGAFNPRAVWFSTDADFKSRVAWGDLNGDGLLDLSVSNGPSYFDTSEVRSKVYLNQRGSLSRDAAWFSNLTGYYSAVALGDANDDGRLDMAVGVAGNDVFSQTEPDRLFLNPGLIEPQTGGQAALHINRTSTDGQTPTALAPADFYAVAGIRDTTAITFSYHLTAPGGTPYRFVKGYYSPNGGGQWFPAIAAGTETNVVGPVSMTPGSDPGQYTHTGSYTWDVLASGFFGQSDDVVFRLEAYRGYTPTHNSTAESFQQARISGHTFPFRVRGTQVQVISGTTPVSGALVYRLPAGESVGGRWLGSRRPFTTDSNGYLQGRGQIAPGDQLLALAPVALPPGYTNRYSHTMSLYFTNGSPTENGSTAYTVTPELGVQVLQVSADNPLLLFDLDVALEWDASNDPAYLNQLAFDLRRASAHLYDFTNGQVALGDIYVTQNAERWPQSHILVHATNRLRPYATVGGIVLTPTVALSPAEGITYSIGQVHMGATWNRYGNPAQSIGVDWPVILAHELGHYLLFLEDTYLGLEEFDGAEVLVSVDSCAGSAMGDVYNINNTEFVQNPGAWQTDCAGTLAAQELSRTEWGTITGNYPWLKAPRVTQPGPGLMPFNLTTVTIRDPLAPVDALEDPTFYLGYLDGDVSSSEARAFLLRNKSGTASGIDAYEYVYDLGSPVGGQNRVLARGAAPGDRLCVFDRARQQFGCAEVVPGRERLPLQKDETWQPVITLSPVHSTSFTVRVDGVTLDSGQQLQARLYPDFGSAFTITQLSPVDGGYAGTLALDYPALKGHVQVWVDKDTSNPRRETIVAYRVGGNPGSDRGSGGSDRGSGGSDRGSGGSDRGSGGSDRGSGGSDRGSGGSDRGSGGSDRGSGANARGEGNAPAVSPDGQMIYFDRNYDLSEGQFYTVQVMAGLPPIPVGKVAIGSGYNLFATGFAPGSLAGSVSFQYRGNDVLAEERSEGELGIHFWDGQQWQALNTKVDTTYNLASARSRGPGIYALLAGTTTPRIQAVSPLTAPNNIATTLTVSGANFLPPVALRLTGTGFSRALTPTGITSATITAAVPAGLPAGSYRVMVENRNQPLTATATSTAVVRLADSAAQVCFADDFENGSGQWLRSGNVDLITVSPGGNHVVSGDGSTDAIVSLPVDLGGCVNPQLSLSYVVDGEASSPHMGLAVNLSGGESGSWQALKRYGPTAAGWQTDTIDLTPYAGQTIRLQFSSGSGQQRWRLDDIIIRAAP